MNDKHPWRRWRRPARELLRALADLLLPPVCPACAAAGAGLCGTCDQQLARRPLHGCCRCGEPVAAGTGCGDDHRDLRHLNRLVAPWRFAGTGGALVRRFKLDGDVGAGRLMVRAMADAWRRAADPEWGRAVLVAVPLHAARRRERGFDQAEWLVEQLARRLGLATVERALARCRATLPQGDPRVRSRDHNVEGAFALRRPGLLAGRLVVLVDDVFTSGATGRACAALLRTAGARAVAMLTACRS